jgi:hypothetical protein
MSDTAAEAKPERLDYGASGGRKTLFCFLFLILLPFFVSLPAMLTMRLKNGLWQDTIGLAILATGFAIIMFLILVELMFSLRAKVHLGEDSVKMTLPSGRGPTPMLRYRTHDIPYDQVHTVETRREIYGGAIAPMLLQGARIVTKEGKTIPLGYVAEQCIDPCFPYPEIARKIAERARLPTIDRGHVRRSLRHKMMGLKSPNADTIVTETEIAALNRSHANMVLVLVSAVLVLMAIGIVDDLSSSTPIGNTATMLNAVSQGR